MWGGGACEAPILHTEAHGLSRIRRFYLFRSIYNWNDSTATEFSWVRAVIRYSSETVKKSKKKRKKKIFFYLFLEQNLVRGKNEASNEVGYAMRCSRDAFHAIRLVFFSSVVCSCITFIVHFCMTNYITRNLKFKKKIPVYVDRRSNRSTFR